MKLTRFVALAAVLLIAGCAGGGTSTESATGTGASSTAGGSAGMSAIVPGSEEDLATNVGDRIYFPFDKAILSAQAQATLDRQAGWLQEHPAVKVQIAGNCDERGTEEYNIALGQRRADIARDYLVAKGVARSRISTISYGKERPLPDAVCNDESCWAKNRNAITAVQSS